MLSWTKNEQGDGQVGDAQLNIGVDRNIEIKMVHVIQKKKTNGVQWRDRRGRHWGETGESQWRARRVQSTREARRRLPGEWGRDLRTRVYFRKRRSRDVADVTRTTKGQGRKLGHQRERGPGLPGAWPVGQSTGPAKREWKFCLAREKRLAWGVFWVCSFGF